MKKVVETLVKAGEGRRIETIPDFKKALYNADFDVDFPSILTYKETGIGVGKSYA